jgi:hypothetical protein
MLTAYGDPGIIPRQPKIREDPFRRFKQTINLQINGVTVQSKWCGSYFAFGDESESKIRNKIKIIKANYSFRYLQFISTSQNESL